MIKKQPAKTSAFVRGKEVEPAAARTVVKDPTRTRVLSVKLDAERYKRYNRARFEMDMSGQEIMVEALDAWLLKKKL